MIDSHCHLDHEPMYSDLNNVINRSKNIGIEKILSICTTISSFEKIKKIVNFDPIIYGTFGIHPHECVNNYVSKENIISTVKQNSKIVAIGESGLDFYYNHSDRQKQLASFKTHIEASLELNMPIIVHSRSAENETYEVLKSYEKFKPKILMHCFTGSTEFANKLINLGSYFSASGIITFNNSSNLRETFKLIPNDKLLIETDSPYLAPVPLRGKKNEPCYIKHTLEKLAYLRNTEVGKMEKITSQNFNLLFNLK